MSGEMAEQVEYILDALDNFNVKLKKQQQHEPNILRDLIELGDEYVDEGCELPELLDALTACYHLTVLPYLTAGRENLIFKTEKISVSATVMTADMQVAIVEMNSNFQSYWMAMELNNNIHSVFARHKKVTGDPRQSNFLTDMASGITHLALPDLEISRMMSGYITFLIINYLQQDPLTLIDGSWGEYYVDSESDKDGIYTYTIERELGSVRFVLDLMEIAEK